MARIAAALGMGGVAASDAPARIADRMDTVFRSLGMPTRLSELGIARESLPQVLELSLTNFNADPKREFVRERETLAEILEAAW
jgi:alcohol dehydrogenase class IV